jgi:hypothetical protein
VYDAIHERVRAGDDEAAVAEDYNLSVDAVIAIGEEACLIAGCTATEIHQEPVLLRDGSIRRACPEHWDAIMLVLGRQHR